MEDVKYIEGIKTDVLRTFNQAIKKRQQIEGHLKTLLILNGECLKKLLSLAENKPFSVSNKTGTVSVKKILKEAHEDAIKEVEDANQMWNGRLTGTVQQIDEVCIFDTFKSIPIFKFYYF